LSIKGVLVNHHSIARDGQVYFGLLKQTMFDNEGTLRLGWWNGYEKLKHKRIDVKLPDQKSEDPIVMLKNTFDTDQGLILEGTLAIPVEINSPSNGLYIEFGDNQGSAILVGFRGVTELGTMQADGSGFNSEKQVDREMSFGKTADFRLLLKHSLLEFYLDDILMECFSLPAKATGRIGLIQGGQNAISDLQAWW